MKLKSTTDIQASKKMVEDRIKKIQQLVKCSVESTSPKHFTSFRDIFGDWQDWDNWDNWDNWGNLNSRATMTGKTP